jgi:hypothetical protein
MVRDDVNTADEKRVGFVCGILDSVRPREEKPATGTGRVFFAVDCQGASTSLHREKHPAFDPRADKPLAGPELKPVGVGDDRAGSSFPAAASLPVDRNRHVIARISHSRPGGKRLYWTA